MASNQEQALERLKKQIGTTDGPSDWHTIDQKQINLFADATGDHQFIHIDPERAKATPFGGTIAHGFLTLSLLPFLQGKLRAGDPAVYQGLAMAVNYGLDKVRFPSPVKTGSRVRLKRQLVSAEPASGNAVQTKHVCTIEIEGADKPACVAESLTRFFYM
jgi:acyl dehydratase